MAPVVPPPVRHRAIFGLAFIGILRARAFGLWASFGQILYGKYQSQTYSTPGERHGPAARHTLRPGPKGCPGPDSRDGAWWRAESARSPAWVDSARREPPATRRVCAAPGPVRCRTRAWPDG